MSLNNPFQPIARTDRAPADRRRWPIPMPEDIRLSPDATHFVVTSAGPPSLDELTQTLARLAELRRQHQIDKILVDSRARNGQPSVSSIYRGGELLAERFGLGTRVAVLVRRIEGDHRLFENVAVNRGATVAFFDDKESALGWLLQSNC